MDLTTFIQQRRPEWRRLEQMLGQVEGSGLASLDDEQAVEFGRLYRRAASDLNQAQTFVTGAATERYLNDLVARAYLAVYGKRRSDFWAPLRYFWDEYPRVFRRCLPHFLVAVFLFAVGGLLGYLVSAFDAGLARPVLMPAMATIKPPKEGEADDTPLMTTGQLSAFSSMLFANNVGVSFFAFALGVTFGIGSAWLMFYNGLVLGVLTARFVEAGQFQALATGVLPHGVLEIPAALLGGAAGFVLAEGMIRARPWPRRQEIARKAREALMLVSGCLPLLAVAALLEAGVARAPDWFLGRGLKLAVAGVFALLFLAYLLLLGWRRPASEVQTE
jgi:uncharacterized membrane protein SpoIIM required for sporulation